MKQRVDRRVNVATGMRRLECGDRRFAGPAGVLKRDLDFVVRGGGREWGY